MDQSGVSGSAPQAVSPQTTVPAGGPAAQTAVTRSDRVPLLALTSVLLGAVSPSNSRPGQP
jgi:hypothetical protein